MGETLPVGDTVPLTVGSVVTLGDTVPEMLPVRLPVAETEKVTQVVGVTVAVTL